MPCTLRHTAPISRNILCCFIIDIMIYYSFTSSNFKLLLLLFSFIRHTHAHTHRHDRISIFVGLTIWLISYLKSIGWRGFCMIYSIQYIRLNVRALLHVIATIRFKENFKAIGQTAIKGSIQSYRVRVATHFYSLFFSLSIHLTI